MIEGHLLHAMCHQVLKFDQHLYLSLSHLEAQFTVVICDSRPELLGFFNAMVLHHNLSSSQTFLDALQVVFLLFARASLFAVHAHFER